MEQVIVEIDAEGNVKVEAQGVRGSGCAALTRAIEESLGRTTADQKKPEFFQQAGQGGQQKEQARAGSGR